MQEIRPDYYKSGGMEALDVIDAFDLNFNLGNAFKYIARAGKKGDKAEDLRKAVTYLNREIEKEDKKRIDEDFSPFQENIEKAQYTLTEIYWEDPLKCEKEDLQKTGLHYGAFNSYEDAHIWLFQNSYGSVCPTGWDDFGNIYYYDKRQYELSKDDPEHGNNGYAKYFWVVEKIDNWNFKVDDEIDDGFTCIEIIESDYEAGRQENL